MCFIINMKIYNIQNPIYNTQATFKGSSNKATKPDIDDSDFDKFEQEKPHKNKANKNKAIPEWVRKSMLFTMVFLAFKNDPSVQELIHPYEPTQEEIDKDKFVHDYGNLIKEKGISTAFYQLDRLNEFEQPKVKEIGKNSYSIEFDLDKQKVTMEMTLDKNNKDSIHGRVKLDNSDFVKYTAVFSDNNKDEFKILINDKKNRKYVFGRDYFGELYKIQNGKKVQLNKKNVKRYEDYQETLEDLDKLEFFTNKNDFWRKANIVLLIFLLFNEMAHDKRRQQLKRLEEKEKELEKKDKKLADLIKQFKEADTVEKEQEIMNKILDHIIEDAISKQKEKDKKEDNKNKDV